MSERPAPRCGFVLDCLSGGGTEEQFRRWLEAWPETPRPPVFVFTPPGPELERWQTLTGVHVLGRDRDATLPLRLARAARREGVPLLVAGHRFAGLMAKFSRIFNPGCHICCSERGWHQWGVKGTLMYDVVDRALSPLADCVLTNSIRALRSRSAAIGISCPVKEVPNALSDEFLRGPTAESAVAGSARIVSVGRVEPVKRPELAIEIGRELASRGFDFRWQWIGHGTLREGLSNVATGSGSRGRVEFVGPRSDLSAVLSGATALVHPAQWEFSSGAILEARAAGLPVIAADVGGNPDQVRSGHNGFLLGGEDAREWAEAVITVHEDPAIRSRCVSEAQSVRHRHDPHVVVHQLIEALDPAGGER